jgi:hypothetical protein
MERKKIILWGCVPILGIVAITTILVIILILLNFSRIFISFYEERPQNFYNRAIYGDHIWRLPIIRPYMLLSADGKSWQLHVEKENLHTFDENVIDIGIIDKTTFVVSSKINRTDTSSLKWDIIDVSSGKDTTFKSKEACENYFHQINSDSVKIYHDITRLYRDFEEKRKLPPEWAQQP